ncbi:MAG: ABC transporter permease [Thermomicrobiales bacterium]|nr:ABC transporter permease [Thermomicrobiales bacterium]
MNLPKYVLQRVIQTIPMLLFVLVLVFSLTRLTGDPASLMLGDAATNESVGALRDQWGLNDPLLIQFWDYIRNLLTGDMGASLRYSRPVADLIGERLMASMVLVTASVIISVVVSVPLGVLAARRWNRKEDTLIRLFVVVGQAVPRFYLGILLMLLFGLRLRWLPTSGYGTWKHLLLPAFTLATPTIALLTRLVRSSMLEVLSADYIRTARAKGLGERSVVYRHALRNALMAPITMLAIQAAQLVGSAVVVEQVFGWPGLGRLALDAIYARDFPLIQGIVLILCLIVIVTNLVVDVSYGFINPQARAS